MRIILRNSYHGTSAGVNLGKNNTISLRQARRVRSKLCPNGRKCECGKDILGCVGPQAYKYKIITDEKGEPIEIKVDIAFPIDSLRVNYRGYKVIIEKEPNKVVFTRHLKRSPYYVIESGFGRGTVVKGIKKAQLVGAYFLGLIDGFKRGYNKGLEDRYYG